MADTRDAGGRACVVPVAVRDGVMGVALESNRGGGGNVPRPRDELRVDGPPGLAEVVVDAKVAVCDRSRRGSFGSSGGEGEVSPVSDSSSGERRGWD